MENLSFENDSKSKIQHQTNLKGTPVKEYGTSSVPQNDTKREVLDRVDLKKNIGVTSGVGLVVGMIIGSGIFISPKGVLLGTGSIGATLIVWFIGGVYAFVGSWAFAELGLMIPSSGGQYIYLLECFAPNRRKQKTFIGPLVAFLYVWQFVIFGKPAAQAVQVMACASYLIKLTSLDCLLINHGQENEVVTKLIAVLLLALITTISCSSNEVATKFINFFTFAKIFALIFVIIGAMIKFGSRNDAAINTGFDDTKLDFHGFAVAFYSTLWAYSGWDNLNLITKEIINPEKNLPKALFISCSLVTVIYMATNISYFILLSKEQFLSSAAVAVDSGYILLGSIGSVFMVLSVAFSIFGSTTGGSFTSVRTTYAAAQEGHMVEILSYLNINYMAPTPALWFSFILSLIAIWKSDILSLITLVGFFDTFFLLILIVGFLRIRNSERHANRTYKAPLIAPVTIIIVAVFLILATLLTKPRIEYLYVLLLILGGVFVYIPFVYYKYSMPKLGKISRLVQLALNVCPPDNKDCVE